MERSPPPAAREGFKGRQACGFLVQLSRRSVWFLDSELAHNKPLVLSSLFSKHLRSTRVWHESCLSTCQEKRKMSTNVFNPVSPQLVVQNYFNLVQAIAAKIKRRLPAHVDVEDLVQTGMIGLLE